MYNIKPVNFFITLIMKLQKTLLSLIVISTAFFSGCQKKDSPEEHEPNATTTSNSQEISDDELLASGQWRDPETGVIWMRCAIGQKWENSTCIGDPILLDARQATQYFDLFNNEGGFAGHTNWRLPSIGEASVIRKCPEGWDYQSERKEVLTVNGPELQTVEGELITIDIPINNEIVKVPKNCAIKEIIHNKDTSEENIERIPNNAYDHNIFIKPDNMSHWTSTRSNGSILSLPVQDSEGVWIYSMGNGQLMPQAAAYQLPIRAVRLN